jgi:hypothetical protein
MTTIAQDADALAELDDGTRRAWSAYRERLRELTGTEYEAAESESWTELQDELSRIDDRRRMLNQTSS